MLSVHVSATHVTQTLHVYYLISPGGGGDGGGATGEEVIAGLDGNL